jgi:flagellar assembly protein FliH
MSSFDPIREVGPTAGEFAPFAPVQPVGSCGAGASVFPDFDRPPGAVAERAAAEHEAPAAEVEAATGAAYAAGFSAGQAAARQELVVDATAFAKAVDEIARFRAGLVQRYERELFELALGVARKVVQRELAEHPEHWLGMIREAVRRTLDRETIRIRVGTILHRFLLEHLPALRALLEDVKELDLVEDLALGETGCVIESGFGELDLSIDGQIGAIRAALTQLE